MKTVSHKLLDFYQNYYEPQSLVFFNTIFIKKESSNYLRIQTYHQLKYLNLTKSKELCNCSQYYKSFKKKIITSQKCAFRLWIKKRTSLMKYSYLFKYTLILFSFITPTLLIANNDLLSLRALIIDRHIDRTLIVGCGK